MIFVALAPGLLFSLATGIYAIRQSSPYGPRAFDFSGLGCLAVAFSCLLLLCSYASSLPLLPCLGLVALGLLAVGIFLRQETCLLQQGKAPLLNLDVFHSASFDGAVLALVLVQFLCLGIGFLLPNYAQLVLRTDPFSAGCILLPGCLVGAALAPVSGRLYDRLGAAKPLLVGSLCILLSLVGVQPGTGVDRDPGPDPGVCDLHCGAGPFRGKHPDLRHGAAAGSHPAGWQCSVQYNAATGRCRGYGCGGGAGGRRAADRK